MSHVFTAIRIPKTLAGFVLGCCLAFTSPGVQSATAHSATIQWAANSESDLAGYKVYQGTTPGVYGPSVDVGNTTIYTAQNLQAGRRYYFAITAYDNAGNESLPSFEVSQQTPTPPSTLKIESVGDLDGDGKADIVWRNTNIGDVGGWQGNGVNAPTTTGVIVGTLPAAWVIAGVGDLNGDGTADIVLRNTSTGDVAGWQGNGVNAPTTTGVIVAGLPAAWKISGVGDLNGDGTADIVLRNTSTGDVAVWQGNGVNAPTTTGVIAGTLPAAWVIAGMGDLDGDGKADIVLRNTDTGDVAGWQGNGVNAPTTTGIIATGVDAAWSIQGVGDLDGDGKADIVWRRRNGDVAGWLGNGLTLGQTGIIATGVDAAWSIQGVGDLSGDGKADIVWRHTNGDVAAWLGNGLTLGQTGIIAREVPLE